jgi:hypothetical protein
MHNAPVSSLIIDEIKIKSFQSLFRYGQLLSSEDSNKNHCNLLRSQQSHYWTASFSHL